MEDTYLLWAKTVNACLCTEYMCIDEHVNMSAYSEDAFVSVCVWACFYKTVDNNQERDGPLKTSQWETDTETDAASETGDQ